MDSVCCPAGGEEVDDKNAELSGRRDDKWLREEEEKERKKEKREVENGAMSDWMSDRERERERER
jgi:hypothetical protein